MPAHSNRTLRSRPAEPSRPDSLTDDNASRAPERCNCSSLRQAARHVTRYYDYCLAPTGLRATQYSILSMLASNGPSSMSDLAGWMVMDRATVGHNLRPLERDGLIGIEVDPADRRSRKVSLSKEGKKRERAARKDWEHAQAHFAQEFGVDEALAMRSVSGRIARLTLPTADAPR